MSRDDGNGGEPGEGAHARDDGALPGVRTTPLDVRDPVAVELALLRAAFREHGKVLGSIQSAIADLTHLVADVRSRMP